MVHPAEGLCIGPRSRRHRKGGRSSCRWVAAGWDRVDLAGDHVRVACGCRPRDRAPLGVGDCTFASGPRPASRWRPPDVARPGGGGDRWPIGAGGTPDQDLLAPVCCRPFDEHRDLHPVCTPCALRTGPWIFGGIRRLAHRSHRDWERCRPARAGRLGRPPGPAPVAGGDLRRDGCFAWMVAVGDRGLGAGAICRWLSAPRTGLCGARPGAPRADFLRGPRVSVRSSASCIRRLPWGHSRARHSRGRSSMRRRAMTCRS